jgi:hypothetical protein
MAKDNPGPRIGELVVLHDVFSIHLNLVRPNSGRV